MIQELLGHSKSRHDAGLYACFDEALREAVDRFHPRGTEEEPTRPRASTVFGSRTIKQGSGRGAPSADPIEQGLRRSLLGPAVPPRRGRG